LRETVETYLEEISTENVSPRLQVLDTRAIAEAFTFSDPRDATDVLGRLAPRLMHAAHPLYFGFFNPAHHEHEHFRRCSYFE
jgi:hypothetical protein